MNYFSLTITCICILFVHSNIICASTSYAKPTEEMRDINPVMIDSLPLILATEPFEGSIYNIEQKFIRVTQKDQHDTIVVIDVYKENPFIKLGFEIVPNESTSKFFFVKLSEQDYENTLKVSLHLRMFERIENRSEYPIGFIYYSVDSINGNNFIVTYTLDVHKDYYETYGLGYAVSIMHIYDKSGNLIHALTFDGGVLSNSAISKDGEYLMVIKNNDPYWVKSHNSEFQVFKLSNQKLLYSEIFQNLYSDISVSWIEGIHNLAATLINPEFGIIFYLDSNKNILYKSEKIDSLYAVYPFFENGIKIGYRDKPHQLLNLEKDFNSIQL